MRRSAHSALPMIRGGQARRRPAATSIKAASGCARAPSLLGHEVTRDWDLPRGADCSAPSSSWRCLWCRQLPQQALALLRMTRARPVVSITRAQPRVTAELGAGVARASSTQRGCSSQRARWAPAHARATQQPLASHSPAHRPRIVDLQVDPDMGAFDAVARAQALGGITQGGADGL